MFFDIYIYIYISFDIQSLISNAEGKFRIFDSKFTLKKTETNAGLFKANEKLD